MPSGLERAPNRFAQFQAQIDGAKVHFVHERAAGDSVDPSSWLTELLR
jgi:hypothetical protein